jgi:hypothetical protein
VDPFVLIEVAIGLLSWLRPRQSRTTTSDVVEDVAVRLVSDPGTSDFKRVTELLHARFRADERPTDLELSDWLRLGRGSRWNPTTHVQRVYGAFDERGQAIGLMMFVYYPRRRRALIQYLAVRKGLHTSIGQHVAQRLLHSAERFLTKRLIRCSEIVIELPLDATANNPTAATSRERRFGYLAGMRGIRLYRLQCRYRAPSLTPSGLPRPMILCFGRLLGRRTHIRQVSGRYASGLLKFIFLTAYADTFDADPAKGLVYRRKLREQFEEESESLRRSGNVVVEPLYRS